MSFTPLPRVSNFYFNTLKDYLALYPQVEQDLEWRKLGAKVTWNEAVDALELVKPRYKRSYYQQAVLWGLEDRGAQGFNYQRYLLMFEDEPLKQYCQFWFQTYYAPNPYVQYSG